MPSKFNNFQEQPLSLLSVLLVHPLVQGSELKMGYLKSIHRLSPPFTLLIKRCNFSVFLKISSRARAVCTFTRANLGHHDRLFALVTIESNCLLSDFLRSTAFALSLESGYSVFAYGYRNGVRVTHTNAHA